jgi:hypothetical protein
MRRRRFLLAVGTALSLAGCSSDTPSSESEPKSSTATGTVSPTAADGPEQELLPYLFTAEGLGDAWTRTAQTTDGESGPNFAERVFRNEESDRELFVGLRAQDSVPLAEQATESALGQFAGGESLDGRIGDETYAAYPEAFETGVLFRAGRYVGLVALAANDPTREAAFGRAEALHENLP